jgi:hypothetical protein
MDVAHKDVVLSDGWNLFDFARELGAAESLPVEFRTLPVVRYDVIDGQDVNIVDPAAIKREVQAAFGQEAPKTTTAAPIPASVVDVHNVGGVAGQAATLSAALTARGYRAGEIGNGTADDSPTSSVTYGPGAAADAETLAETLGGLPVSASTTLAAGHVRVVVGADFTLPTELTPTTTTTSATPTTTVPGGSTTPLPDAGKPVTTTIGSTIPCVN